MPQTFQDALKHTAGIPEGFIVPEPQHSIALTFEECAMRGIATPAERVLTSIELDDHSCIEAAKIDDEGADRVLPAKLEASKPPVTKE